MTPHPTLAGNSTELEILLEISKLLVRRNHMDELWDKILEVLRGRLPITRAALTLRHSHELVIEASFGLTDLARSLGKYKIGEGITGRVAQSGKPEVIPDTTTDHTFLNRTRIRKEDQPESFLCVPIIHDEVVIGTFSIDYPQQSPEELDKLLNLMIVLANIMADAVEAFRAEVGEREHLQTENDRLRQQLGRQTRLPGLIGNSSPMREIQLQIIQVARSSATVLIRGESGTGKELIAQSIHYNSDRKQGPFIAVNCAALPENLVESELFGHEKGAFTGAHKMRKGRFEAASGGTLFLDEIGDISPGVQVKLLRVLQERIFERVGAQEPIRTNVRVIAATSRNLEEKMQEGSFREDLFYRLNVFPIIVPPLRSRKSDIVSLADYFLGKYNASYNKNILRISTPAINMLMSYHWPGNVRELENVIERAVLVSDNGVINSFDLPPSLQTAIATNTSISTIPGTSTGMDAQIASFETEIITDALKRNQGNVAASARDLQTTIRKLHYKINKLGITPPSYK